MNPISLRISEALDARVEAAAKASGLSKQDIMKLAMDAGLKWLANNSYDVTREIQAVDLIGTLHQLVHEVIPQLIAHRAARDAKVTGLPPPQSRVAEPATPYKVKRVKKH